VGREAQHSAYLPDTKPTAKKKSGGLRVSGGIGGAEALGCVDRQALELGILTWSRQRALAEAWQLTRDHRIKRCGVIRHG
jgi:hypothetical protein